MTTFKNNAKYAELLMSYLDLSMMEDNPLTPQEVLRTMPWKFKGGSMWEVSNKTRLKPVVSEEVFPDGLSKNLAESWGNSADAFALERVLKLRVRTRRRRATDALLGTWLMMTSSYGGDMTYSPLQVFTGMRSIYRYFARIWEDAATLKGNQSWDLLSEFTREMSLGSSAACHMYIPAVEERFLEYKSLLTKTRVQGLLVAISQLKDIMRALGSRSTKGRARSMGREERSKWEHKIYTGKIKKEKMSDLGWEVLCDTMQLGHFTVRVSQEVVVLGIGPTRYALSKGDLERLHQLTMSTASCLVGTCAQAALGTVRQKKYAQKTLMVAEANIERVIKSSGLVPLGDEVLVCKGYRRAYTAHLGHLAGNLCRDETRALMLEAEETAPAGVLDVAGYCGDLRLLDAAGSLNAGKVFKICPAPDVSPGGAMLDRIKQIGDCNIFDPEMKDAFMSELRSQILRAYIRVEGVRLELRDETVRPVWLNAYRRGELNEVPSMEIDQYLKWEGSAKMPFMSPHDPGNWKDSGLGADTIMESETHYDLGVKKNMLTRLLFDDECPMPGRNTLSGEHVIKFFVKAEGHKDPARGIFSANLTDRQAQSWMEKAVEIVSRKHPSFMIGSEIDERDLKVRQLTARPKKIGWVALYYSFDISGWSAKMPAEPQRISHDIWAKLYGGHLFSRAHEINEGAHIYLSLEGYQGWFKNTAANLEGFNGKEMTMVLVALLSLSVRVWRERVVEEGLLLETEAKDTVALLFAYIDDGLSRIDLPVNKALAAFNCYKTCVIETFGKCGFTVETSKCFPSDRFAIFLNEVYIAGRHVVHGVRAAMGISSEPTERHTTLVERATSVATGCRGAVMAGMTPLAAVFLLSYHLLLHLLEWCNVRKAPLLSIWCLAPRSWGGLGMPNLSQLSVSGSGAAFEEGVATMQAYAKINRTARAYYINSCRSKLEPRDAVSVLTAPLSSRIGRGYMRDSRVAGMVRDALQKKMQVGKVSRYAERLLRYGDMQGFKSYAAAVVHVGLREVIQEQMLTDILEAHPHAIFSAFAKRVEKSVTVSAILGGSVFASMLRKNRQEALESMEAVKERLSRPYVN